MRLNREKREKRKGAKGGEGLLEGVVGWPVATART